MASIRLNNVDVRIPIFDSSALRLFKRGGSRSSAKVGSHDFVSSRTLEVQALTDVTLHLQDGDRVALIGHNGAGKTTLLRTLAGIYPISGGERIIEGSTYMFGGTTTINPDATGYENLRLAMQLGYLPMNRFEEYKRDIEEFTELGEYLAMPARIYSAGMTARLSFAIATMYTPEILLIDEAIGAGDAAFADKVQQRIHHFTNRASIIAFASHSVVLVQKMCNKGAVFSGGRLVFFGPIDQALAQYGQPVASLPPKKVAG